MTVGSDNIAVTILTMASVNTVLYRKAACFHSLSTAAYGLLDTYSLPTVIMFVSQQIPINTSMALTEASNIGAAIKANLLEIQNLTPLSFIKRNWNAARISGSKDLAKREEGLYGVRFNATFEGQCLKGTFWISVSWHLGHSTQTLCCSFCSTTMIW